MTEAEKLAQSEDFYYLPAPDQRMRLIYGVIA